MKLRDLTEEQRQALCNLSDKRYDEWKKSHGLTPKSEEHVWQWAFSRGVAAILETEFWK